MIAVPEALDQRLSPEGRAHDPVAQRYRACFALLDWRQVPARDPSRPWPTSRRRRAASAAGSR